LIIPALSSIPDVSPDIHPIILVEIPADFPKLKAEEPALASKWRQYTRTVFEGFFAQGYLITDFVHEASENPPTSHYVLSFGEATL
jgi:predicted GNAT superfamily acetyltransferase